MTPDDAQFEAEQGLHLSLFYFFPFSWEDVRNGIKKLKKTWFRHIAACVIEGRYNDEDRLLARAWFKEMAKFAWGALFAKHEGGENNFLNAAEIDKRLTEAGLLGPVVRTAIRKAAELSERWPDGPVLTGWQAARMETEIRAALQDDHEMGMSWEEYSKGIMSRQTNIRPILPTFANTLSLLGRCGIPVSGAGIEFLRRALPNPEAKLA